jgi:hypothetical protein
MADLVLHSQASIATAGEEPERLVKTSLLLYDDEYFSDEALSNDLREQLELDPSIGRIYVLAPRVRAGELLQQIAEGTSLIRTSQHENRADPMLRILTAERQDAGSYQLVDCHFVRENASHAAEIKKVSVEPTLIQGWLFDLFVQSKGMVLAPSGVHFGKTSGKHSDRFLRTANVLLTSGICRLLAFFCLPLLPSRRLRQVYVDTAPLLSVGLALLELCKLHGLPVDSGRIRSFSSYSGVRGSLEFRDSDLLLISASTSGGLVREVLDRGAKPDATITVFYLQAKAWNRTAGQVLADLTHRAGNHYGFAEVSSYEHSKCELCDRGLLLAEFEGDQFLLERRKTKRLKATKRSQHVGARRFFELAARRDVISVALTSSGRNKYSDVHFDISKLIVSEPEVKKSLSFRIRRAIPVPLDMVVSDDTTVADLSKLSSVAARIGINPNLPQFTSNNLDTVVPLPEAGVLVFFSTLNNDLVARSINRSLRSAAPQGTVSYVAALVAVDSPEAKRDLLSFIKYGERGPNTFQFDSLFDLLLTQRDERSSWELERELIAQVAQAVGLPNELESRLKFLESTSRATDALFLVGQSGQQKIGSNFVYLDTTSAGNISQADVYAVVSNLLAASRNDDREMEKPLPRGDDAQIWETSVYGQVLLCPRNFKDYNDGVLHSALLRAAKRSELRYDSDPALSDEMLEILLGEIQAWQYGSGQALGEFAMAIATGRLTLVRQHSEEIERNVRLSSFVPDWIKLIVSARTEQNG